MIRFIMNMFTWTEDTHCHVCGKEFTTWSAITKISRTGAPVIMTHYKTCRNQGSQHCIYSKRVKL